MPRRSAAARHAILLGLALAWVALVVDSITYRDALWFRYYVVNLAWLQYLFMGLAAFGAALLLAGAVARGPRPGRWPHPPAVTVVIPAKDEVAVIEGAVRAACAQVYDGDLQVVVVDDWSTDGTSAVLERLRAELPVEVVRTRPGSLGKAAALAAGVAASRGELIAVFDADARPGPRVIATLVPHLADPRVGAVQGRRLVHNAGRNWLTRAQDDEYRVFTTLMQRARQALGGFVLLAGNGLIVRRSALAAVGGWNEEALTEDVDLSIRLHLAGWDVRYCYEAEIWEEGVVTLRDLIRQRERWFEGGLLCLGTYLPEIVGGRLPLLRRVDMVFFLSGSILSTLALVTGYLYMLLALAVEVVVYLQLPRDAVMIASAAATTALAAAAAREVGVHPVHLLGTIARWSVFTMHTLLVVPLSIRRYVYAAVTGARDWRKTAHEGVPPP
ncbi:MAG: glycosyltransferase family 2 protein [Armatimonadota bacterium]|nr:glycosyltransferase family 2 protein [Armatimonadota bacterium]MDR7453435.1 glycosyltransferase family 2 protein [Armatimonadota bacterium]MDR7457345.1 glycosyltransferase family 2 protein [Armatimonadota bacterium]MDR7495653.1 glycosyltransferase family 2 protein [Armatimonadota bacterium]MDR7511591.1 glycosyltransferase family 2 protein [Armatimonadota bacterium]